MFAKKNSVTCLFFFCKNCFFIENRYANLRWLFYNNKKIDYLYWWILFSVIIVSFCELVCYDMYIYTIYSYTVYTYIVESQSCTVGNAIAYLWKLYNSARSLRDCTIDDPLFICYWLNFLCCSFFLFFCFWILFLILLITFLGCSFFSYAVSYFLFCFCLFIAFAIIYFLLMLLFRFLCCWLYFSYAVHCFFICYC